MRPSFREKNVCMFLNLASRPRQPADQCNGLPETVTEKRQPRKMATSVQTATNVGQKKRNALSCFLQVAVERAVE